MVIYVNFSCRAVSVNVDDVIESVYSQTSNGTLPQPIPLGQMISMLMDFWEGDGLFE